MFFLRNSDHQRSHRQAVSDGRFPRPMRAGYPSSLGDIVKTPQDPLVSLFSAQISFGRRLGRAAILVLGMTVFVTASLAQTGPGSASTHTCSKQTTIIEIAKSGGGVSAKFANQVVPDQNNVTLTILQNHPGEGALFNAFIQWKEKNGWKEAKSLLVISSAKEDQSATSLVLAIPDSPHYLFDAPARISVAACKKGTTTPVFVAVSEVEISSRGGAAWLAGLLVTAAYLALAAIVRYSRRDKSHFNQARFLRSLDPVVITSGYLGRGSLSKFQILFFTMIVAGLLSYILVRTGGLSNLSNDVLLLLGIAGAGAAGGKLTSVTRNRLTFENWSWIVEKSWITEQEGQKQGLPSWVDLIMEGGEFNIYKFQMLVFSLIVGISLLTAGLSELASFTIPPALLGVLGLSQVVYVGGKAVTPPSWSELDQNLTKLKEQDLAFTSKVGANLDCLPKDSEQALEASRDCAKDEYAEFEATETTTRRMVKMLFKLKQPLQKLPPTLPNLPICSDTAPPATVPAPPPPP